MTSSPVDQQAKPNSYEDILVVRESRLRKVGALCLSMLLIFAGGFILRSQASDVLLIGMSLEGIGFVTMLLSFLALSDSRPVLVISSEGIRLPRLMENIIPWNEIEAGYSGRASSKEFSYIGIVPRNLIRLLRPASPASRRRLFRTLSYYSSPLAVATTGTSQPHQRIVDEIRGRTTYYDDAAELPQALWDLCKPKIAETFKPTIIDRFSIPPFTGPLDKRPARFRLYFDGKPTSIKVSGDIVQYQLEIDAGYVVIVTDDAMFEEGTIVLLIDRNLKTCSYKFSFARPIREVAWKDSRRFVALVHRAGLVPVLFTIRDSGIPYLKPRLTKQLYTDFDEADCAEEPDSQDVNRASNSIS